MGVEVTQADRDAAAKCYEQGHLYDPCCPPKVVGRRMREGHLDGSSYVQAFAAHRIAGEADLRRKLDVAREALGQVSNMLLGHGLVDKRQINTAIRTALATIGDDA